MRHFLLSILLLAASSSASAQTIVASYHPQAPRTVTLDGPRFGVTSLSDGVVTKLAEREITVRPNITQFGWQFERQVTGLGNGLTAINELVLLLGGLDQGVAIPSASWLVGLRTREGTEFGVGPNVTPAGVALAVAFGVTLKTGSLNIPLNVAVVPSKAGTRVSFLTGFNVRRR